jgi:hypothetical protein
VKPNDPISGTTLRCEWVDAKAQAQIFSFLQMEEGGCCLISWLLAFRQMDEPCMKPQRDARFSAVGFGDIRNRLTAVCATVEPHDWGRRLMLTLLGGDLARFGALMEITGRRSAK